MASNRHCFKCGWEWTLSAQPARTESCHQCHNDMRACRNCIHYAPRVSCQCKERRAEPVENKESANFCEYFEFIRREWQGDDSDKSREDKARDALKKLLGD